MQSLKTGTNYLDVLFMYLEFQYNLIELKIIWLKDYLWLDE